jgi:hypothetical protein
MADKKNDKLHIPCTSELKAKLKANAEECHMNLSSYCLFILSHAKPKVTIENNF